jgi:hypothetical protein
LFYEIVHLFVNLDALEWEFAAVNVVARYLFECKALNFTFSPDPRPRRPSRIESIGFGPSSALCRLIAENRNGVRAEHFSKLSLLLGEFLNPTDFETMPTISVE